MVKGTQGRTFAQHPRRKLYAQPGTAEKIPKPDGGVRKQGIPTVVEHVIQQAIAQKLQSPQSDAGSEGVHPWLDWLFPGSRYETDADVLG